MLDQMSIAQNVNRLDKTSGQGIDQIPRLRPSKVREFG